MKGLPFFSRHTMRQYSYAFRRPLRILCKQRMHPYVTRRRLQVSPTSQFVSVQEIWNLSVYQIFELFIVDEISRIEDHGPVNMSAALYVRAGTFHRSSTKCLITFTDSDGCYVSMCQLCYRNSKQVLDNTYSDSPQTWRGYWRSLREKRQRRTLP